jgi:N-acetylglutamate synthase-like GNAT family acetyltransferase
LAGIKALVVSVGGDQDNLQSEQFVVAHDDEGNILGCGRLKPYPDCTELASIAVARGSRSSGMGRGIVGKLLERRQGTIHLICEDDVVEFFRRFGFEVVPLSEMPQGLAPKWQYYAAQVSHLNVMRRD